jgi:hypothetical protein
MAGYGSDGEFATWMASLGYTLPGTAPTPAVLRQRGSDYIDAVYGARFIGYPTGGVTQERAWPRTEACWRGGVIDPAAIPVQVVTASYYAAYQEAVVPGSLAALTSSSGAVKREKVGDLEVEYADAGGSASVKTTAPILSTVDGLLAPFLTLDPAITPAWMAAVG